MIGRNEAERLAAMAHALRPDWPVSSLMTMLRQHQGRAYRDLAVALAWIATDPETKTPARLNESGPWWRAVTAGDGSTSLASYRMKCAEHSDEVLPCPACKAEKTPPSEDTLATLRQAAKAAKGQAPRPAITKPRRPDTDLSAARARADQEAS